MVQVECKLSANGFRRVLRQPVVHAGAQRRRFDVADVPGEADANPVVMAFEKLLKQFVTPRGRREGR